MVVYRRVYITHMNPFDECGALHEYDRKYGSRIVKNPFADCGDEMSPIAVAVNTEAMRQAELLFRGAFDEVDLSRTRSRLPEFVTGSSFSNEDLPSIVVKPPAESASVDSTIATMMMSDPFGRANANLSRSKTDGRIGGGARPNTSAATLTPGAYTIVRAASAKAVIARRSSSRFERMSLAPRSGQTDAATDDADNLSRTASSRSISSRAGAIAVGDDSEIELVKSHSSHYIGNHIAQRYLSPPGSARANSADPIGDAEYMERCECIFELIKRKFLKHVRCEPCDESRFCMCTNDCEAPADVFSERYGRLHNRMRVKPAYYAMGHLVDLFIDAYDEEKRMRDIDNARV